MNVLTKYFGLKPAGERLILFFMFVLLFTHLMSCFWYFSSKFEDTSPNTWVYRLGLRESEPYELYIVSFYYILTTITTVGYGDITPVTITERIMCIFLFIFGVLFFSFSIGSLTSVLSSLNVREAKLQEKIKLLDMIKKEYNVPFSLYNKLY